VSVVFISGMVWTQVKTIYKLGYKIYCSDIFNIMESLVIILYLMAIGLMFDTQRNVSRPVFTYRFIKGMETMVKAQMDNREGFDNPASSWQDVAFCIAHRWDVKYGAIPGHMFVNPGCQHARSAFARLAGARRKENGTNILISTVLDVF
jgi:hypothetical protein